MKNILQKMRKLIQRFEEGIFKFRRYYLVKCHPDYVREQLTLRRGECNRCGDCCSIAFKCHHLDGENNCDMYEKRYDACHVFPIEPRDLKYLRHRCSYYFEGEESPCLPEILQAGSVAEKV